MCSVCVCVIPKHKHKIELPILILICRLEGRIAMDLSFTDKGPAAAAVLQLQRWGPSLAHLNLSEFRQAFISPTRQLLLLLSYHSEALFIPLLSGDSYYLYCVASSQFCYRV